MHEARAARTLAAVLPFLLLGLWLCAGGMNGGPALPAEEDSNGGQPAFDAGQAAGEGAAAPEGAGPGYEILLYGRPGCRFCGAMQARLILEELPYTYRNITVDEEAKREMWDLVEREFPDGTRLTLPVMVVNGVLLISPTFEQVREVLDRTARPAR